MADASVYPDFPAPCHGPGFAISRLRCAGPDPLALVASIHFEDRAELLGSAEATPRIAGVVGRLRQTGVQDTAVRHALCQRRAVAGRGDRSRPARLEAPGLVGHHRAGME